MSLTILIVDDEETFRKNTQNYLSAKGYELEGVGTLEEARAHLEHGDADLILLDVQLPDGYGPNLLYETANMAFRPPIILMTAHMTFLQSRFNILNWRNPLNGRVKLLPCAGS
jgi:DNA-binding NtrC family response regulator